MCNNRTEADVNEIYFAYLLNEKQFPDQRTEDHYNSKVAKLSSQAVLEAQTKARYMYEYYKDRYDTNDIMQVWWTGENVTTEKIIGIKINDKECPADVIIRRKSDEDFFGISLKTTKAGRNPFLGDYGVKSLNSHVCIDEGVQMLDFALYDGVHELLPEVAGMTLKQRDRLMKECQPVYDIINEYGDRVLEEFREYLFEQVTDVFNDDDLHTLIVKFLMVESGYAKLKYTQIECCGTLGDGHRVYEDTIIDRLNTAREGNYTFERSGKKGIGIRANGKPLIRIYAKFKSRKMTGTPVVKVEKWNRKE